MNCNISCIFSSVRICYRGCSVSKYSVCRSSTAYKIIIVYKKYIAAPCKSLFICSRQNSRSIDHYSTSKTLRSCKICTCINIYIFYCNIRCIISFIEISNGLCRCIKCSACRTCRCSYKMVMRYRIASRRTHISSVSLIRLTHLSCTREYFSCRCCCC